MDGAVLQKSGRWRVWKMLTVLDSLIRFGIRYLGLPVRNRTVRNYTWNHGLVKHIFISGGVPGTRVLPSIRGAWHLGVLDRGSAFMACLEKALQYRVDENSG